MIKQQKIRHFSKVKGLDAFVFSRRSSFSWLTDGGECGVDEFSEIGAADLVLTDDKIYVVAPINEIDRLMTEDLAGQGYEPVVYSWQDNRYTAIEKLLGSRKAGSDLAVPGCKELYGEIKELRYSLLPGELDRIIALGQSTAALVGKICNAIRPGDREIKIAGEIKGKLGMEGIYAPVVLVAVDERVDQFRHPLPTTKKAEKRVMVVVCARRGGLTVALTRTVYFGFIPEKIRARLELVNNINAQMITATIPGQNVSDIFQETIKAYTAVGFAGEWEKHHQGGPIGYENREYIAFPGCSGVVLENQAFAWNPMISDVKSEETVIASSDGLKMVTYDHNWPYKIYEIRDQSISLPDFIIL